MKKSSQSKRLAKRREKERRKAPDGDNNKYDNNVNEVICYKASNVVVYL